MKTIGLVFGHNLGFSRGILKGISSYTVQKPQWSFRFINPNAKSIMAQYCKECDGIIAHGFGQSLIHALLKLDCFVINVSGVMPTLPFPLVSVDHHKVGQLAAEHFLQRGFTQFGFVGYKNHDFSDKREEGFLIHLKQSGGSTEVFRENQSPNIESSGMQNSSKKLVQWLKRCRKPIAIFASNDVQGFQITQTCRILDINIPNEIAVMGVDQDQLLCSMSRPPLSSVVLPTYQMGIKAAEMLDTLLSGKPLRKKTHILLPLGIVTKKSSETVIVNDSDVHAALQIIHNQSPINLNVSSIVKELDISRRTLQRKFNANLNRSIIHEIQRIKLERSKTLLVDSSKSIQQIAIETGFSNDKQFCTTFHKHFEMTPGNYRQIFQQNRL